MGGEFQGLVEWDRTLLDAGGQCLAFDSLQDHVVGSDVVEGTDVRVIERSHRAGFAFEAGSGIFALGDVFGQDFDGDRAVEAGVAGFVDFAHAPAPMGARTS